MKKLFYALLITLFAGMGFCHAAALRLADATGGAATEVFLQAAVSLARENRLELSMQRLLPGKALAEFDQGEIDGIIIDRRFAGKRHFIPIAAEALALYVSSVNPGAELTAKQVLQLLLAPRPTWESYNHLPMDIQRIAIATARPTGTLIRRIFGAREYSPEIFRVQSASSGFAFTNSASLFFAQFTAIPPQGVKMLPVNGVVPDSNSVLTGKYPLSLHYVLICRKDSPEIKLLMQTLSRADFRKELQDSGMLVMLP